MPSMASRTLPKAKEAPLAGLRGLVVGAGPLGLVTALALAQNGAEITHRHAERLGDGVGFENAAGLIEPVATEDERAGRWTAETDEFCRWALEDDDWGITPRRVLLLSDDPSAVSGGWLDNLRATEAPSQDLVGGRAHGCWFDSHVIQPDLAMRAFKRELNALPIAPGSGMPATRHFKRVEEVS